MINHNNYPEVIINFCLNMSKAMWPLDGEYNTSKNIVDQAVYDVISPKIFKQYINIGNSDSLGINDDEEATIFIKEIYTQSKLLSMVNKGILDTFDDGESFVLTPLGKSYNK